MTQKAFETCGTPRLMTKREANHGPDLLVKINFMKLFILVTDEEAKRARAFVLASFSRLCPILQTHFAAVIFEYLK